MAIEIDTLICKVRVVSRRRGHVGADSPQPDLPRMQFAATPITAESNAEPPPSQVETETRDPDHAEDRRPTDADPKAVADRVFKLFQDEVISGRSRSGVFKNRR